MLKNYLRSSATIAREEAYFWLIIELNLLFYASNNVELEYSEYFC